MQNKITLNEVQKKDIKIIGYLIISGLLGLGSAWVLKRPDLTIVLAPTINYILYRIEKELTNKGYREALKK